MKNRKPRLRPPKGAAVNGSTKLPAEIMNSSAYRALSTGTELKLLNGFYRRRKYDKKTRRYLRADIEYVIQAMCWETDACNQTVLDARDALIAVGLIDCVHTSGGLCNESNLYRLSDRWQKYDSDPDVRKRNGFVERPKPVRQNKGRDAGAGFPKARKFSALEN